jgi:hypothetical protein
MIQSPQAKPYQVGMRARSFILACTPLTADFGKPNFVMAAAILGAAFT